MLNNTLKKLMVSLALVAASAQLPAFADETKQERDMQAVQVKADAGDLTAQTLLAMSYIDGDGVKQDVEKGVAMLKDAAEKGEIFAQLALGAAYSSGIKGFPEDLAQARFWLEKALTHEKAATEEKKLAKEMLEELDKAEEK